MELALQVSFKTTKLYIVFIYILICNCYISFGDSETVNIVKLLDNHIYTFRNKHDSGVLTAINIKGPLPPVVTDKWRDAATQKWRVTSSFFHSGYQLRPTSDETKIVYLDANRNFISQDVPTFLGFNSNEFWKSSYVGHGFHQLKNLKTDQCLQSLGAGKRVGVSLCANTPKQQWQIDAI